MKFDAIGNGCTRVEDLSRAHYICARRTNPLESTVDRDWVGYGRDRPERVDVFRRIYGDCPNVITHDVLDSFLNGAEAEAMNSRADSGKVSAAVIGDSGKDAKLNDRRKVAFGSLGD